MEELLYAKEYKLIGHNIAYDLAVLVAQFPRFLRPVFEAYKENRISDTMLRQKLLDNAIGRFRGYRVEKTGPLKKGEKPYRWISYGYSLDDCYFRLTKKRLDKDTWRLRYGELRDLPLELWPEGAREYPILDAQATWDVWHWQEKQEEKIRKGFDVPRSYIRDAKPLDDESRQCRAAWWIHLMKTWGIRTKGARVHELEHIVEDEYGKLEALLKEAGLVRADGVRNIEAARDRMILAMGGKDKCRLTDKGAVKLDEEACTASGDLILKDYAELGSLKAVKSKDIPALLKGVLMPIHSNFDSLIATGRTSSSAPNIQNIRRLPGIRECFVPREGKVFLNADWDGLELRTLAQVCTTLFGRSKLADVLNSGKDPHLQVAATLLRIPYEEAKARYDAGDESVDGARQLGKVANFGFPGGLGYESLIYFARKNYGLVMSEQAARKLKTNWLLSYPEMEKYFALIDQHCSVDVEDNMAFVQHLFSNRIRGDVPYTVACNSRFQGLGADATKAAGFLIAYACYVDKDSPLYGCRIVNYIHDEFLVECDEAKAHEAAFELARLMVEGSKPFLPDVPPTVSKPIVARWWSKKAKQMWKDGRLIPWEDEFVIRQRGRKAA
jgi:DNA polymerase-1